MNAVLAAAIVLACGLLSPPAQARAGWTDYVTVAEVVLTTRHYFEFRLPVERNPSGCREANWFYLDYGSPGAEQVFKVLLDGIESGLSVRVYVTGICNINGYSEISSISVVR